jgi:hypothetical protein
MQTIKEPLQALWLIPQSDCMLLQATKLIPQACYTKCNSKSLQSHLDKMPVNSPAGQIGGNIKAKQVPTRHCERNAME